MTDQELKAKLPNMSKTELARALDILLTDVISELCQSDDVAGTVARADNPVLKLAYKALNPVYTPPDLKALQHKAHNGWVKFADPMPFWWQQVGKKNAV